MLKHLLPSSCQWKIYLEKISFKFNEVKCIGSVYIFLFNSQFTLDMGYEIHKFWNLYDVVDEFLLLRKTQPSSVIRERSLNIEITKKAFWRHVQIHEENNLCQILFQINS